MDRIQLSLVNTLLKFPVLYMGYNLTSRVIMRHCPMLLVSFRCPELDNKL
jgi:hypothetical protein